MEPMDLAQLLRDVIEEFQDGQDESIDVYSPNARPSWHPSPDVVRRIERALHDLDMEVMKGLRK